MRLKIILLFAASILLTAVFSYSLNVFLQENFITLTLKTILIPCFTWSMLMLLAWVKLKGERRWEYLYIAGCVCAIGSAALVPGGLYNFIATAPDVEWSVISVLACVALMSISFYILLRKKKFSSFWLWAYNILIVINMTFFYLSTKL
jgi:hypothetical protein